DEKEVTYNRTSYLNFTLAYCISIHKAQGSEFSNVILPVVSQYRRMLRKNLLYTAITRSKESLIVCGEIDAFFNGIQTVDTNNRYSTLQHYLVNETVDDPLAKAKQSEENESDGFGQESLNEEALSNEEATETGETLPDENTPNKKELSPYDFL